MLGEYIKKEQNITKSVIIIIVVSTNITKSVILKYIEIRGAVMVNDYADLIKKLRKEMLLSQVEFAELLGVSFASVNRWENGQHEPTIKIKRKLKALFREYKITED